MPKASRLQLGTLYFLQKASIGGEVVEKGKIFLVQHAAPDDSDVKCRRGPSDSYDAGPRVSMSRQWTFSCGGAKDE